MESNTGSLLEMLRGEMVADWLRDYTVRHQRAEAEHIRLVEAGQYEAANSVYAEMVFLADRVAYWTLALEGGAE